MAEMYGSGRLRPTRRQVRAARQAAEARRAELAESASMALWMLAQRAPVAWTDDPYWLSSAVGEAS